MFEHFGDINTHCFAVSGFQDMTAIEIESSPQGFMEKTTMAMASPMLCCRLSNSEV